MAIEVKVPDIGDFQDVPVISILVAVGDTVAAEGPLIELEFDKATMEVSHPVASNVATIPVKEGDRVSQGVLILTVQAEGTADAPASAAPVTDAGFGKAHASPSVRAFARQLGIDLAKINGTGRKGRILREDLVNSFKSSATRAASGGAVQRGMGIPPIPVIDLSKFGPVEAVEMARIKKLTGPALHRSWLNVPHVTHNEEAAITEIDMYRKELDDAAKKEGNRVTLLSFVIKASVSAPKSHREFNSSIYPDGDKLIRKSYYYIGFAADMPNGLVVISDEVTAKQPLIELESDNATMEVPSPVADQVTSIAMKEGDKVAKGSLILVLESAGAAAGGGDVHVEVIVLGTGPGDYTAAFRAADPGAKVVLTKKDASLGGVCLSVGCIPSKALLRAAKAITLAAHLGVTFAAPQADLDRLRGTKDSIIKQQTDGLAGLAKGRKMTVVNGYGRFTGPMVTVPFIPHDDPRVIDSTGAQKLADMPGRLLVLGGGIIGLKMACVHDALGSKITVVELMDKIISGADKDIV